MSKQAAASSGTVDRPDVTSKLYGGTMDGQTLERFLGKRHTVVVDDHTLENYVRDRTCYEYDERHVLRVIAYKLESIEKCTMDAGHDGPCVIVEVWRSPGPR